MKTERCEMSEPLEIDLLLSADQRHTVSVNDQLHFQRCISTDERGIDEIDRELDDHLQTDPFNGDPPSRRKDAELNRVLALLDSLERGTR